MKNASKPSPKIQSAAKVLDVLDILLRNFTHGFSPGELAQATGLEPASITRYVTTLIDAGFAERIPETGRIQVSSSKMARHAVSILRSLEDAKQRLDETMKRINVPI